MIIEFDETFQLETTLEKVDSISDLFHMAMIRKDLIEHTVSRDDYFFTMDQLKDFVTFLNKATCDHI